MGAVCLRWREVQQKMERDHSILQILIAEVIPPAYNNEKQTSYAHIDALDALKRRNAIYGGIDLLRRQAGLFESDTYASLT